MPILLPPNQPPSRFYCGGPQIRAFRGQAADPAQDGGPSHEPEDWVGSTTSCSGSQPLGLTRLPGDSAPLLVDALRSNPHYWLGPEHVRAYGADTKLLVKLLDAGQRLPVHAHPHDDWVKTHLNNGQIHGKAEAWYILTPGEVYLGLQEDTSVDTLKKPTLAQGPSLLRRLYRRKVHPGDAVYVPPGFLHAVGQGVLLVEVQEPADLSILLEWTGFDLDGIKDGHLGVGWDTALTAVDGKGRSQAEIQQLVVTKDMRAEKWAAGDRRGVFADASEEYFRMGEVQLSGGQKRELVPGFSLAIVLDGAIKLSTTGKDGQMLSLTKGSTVLLAYGEGAATFEGSGHVLVARPPRA
jgi:mannose-6-phosphate isomerase